MSSLLQNQVAIITGAGRGIGAATAHLFAAQGASVVVSDRDAEPTEEVVQEIRSAGGIAMGVPGDVTDPAFPDTLIKATMAEYGALHILVNNAGYTWDGMLHKMSDKQWEAMLAVHNTAPFRLVRAASPHMRDAAKKELATGQVPPPRCIINVSSTSGLHGNVGQLNYATAKMGMVGFTKTVAKEWGAFGIRCNAVAFGYIETRLTQAKESGETIAGDGEEIPLGVPSHLHDMVKMMIPLGRTGTVEEAAGSILLLASPFAGYINGHTLEVTGGMGI
ncbi:MAG: SDR family oxidoreductase [Candidatus Hydrogenedentes bacterium]|nr:SDR family oxidoreductase [Candidatus Hydrogenedentota bacterium]